MFHQHRISTGVFLLDEPLTHSTTKQILNGIWANTKYSRKQIF